MEQPVEPILAVMYEETLTRYGKAYEEADRGSYRVSKYDLNEAVKADELPLFVDEIKARIKAWQSALEIVEEVVVSGKSGSEATETFRQACYRFNDYQLAVARYNPEIDTIRNVAEELVKEKARDDYRISSGKVIKSKNWSRASWAIADTIALVTGVTRDEVLEQARAFVVANPMRFAVTTGNLTYLKAGK